MKYLKTDPISFGAPSNERSSLGHVFHNWITGLILAKKYNFEFIHSPFTGDTTKFESILNFWKGYTDGSSIVDVRKLNLPPFDFCHDENTSVEMFDTNIHYFNSMTDQDYEACYKLAFNQFPGKLTQYIELVNEELQQLYWEGKTNYFKDSDKINICIHVRRGDINQNNNPDRWRDDDFYSNLIQELNNKFGKDFIKIHIITEGGLKNIKTFDNVIDHSGISDIDSFHMMCSCDVLITGLSTFSICAAYLNKNIIIYDPLKNFTDWGNCSSRFMSINNINWESIKIKYNLIKPKKKKNAK